MDFPATKQYACPFKHSWKPFHFAQETAGEWTIPHQIRYPSCWYTPRFAVSRANVSNKFTSLKPHPARTSTHILHGHKHSSSHSKLAFEDFCLICPQTQWLHILYISISFNCSQNHLFMYSDNSTDLSTNKPVSEPSSQKFKSGPTHLVGFNIWKFHRQFMQLHNNPSSYKHKTTVWTPSTLLTRPPQHNILLQDYYLQTPQMKLHDTQKK